MVIGDFRVVYVALTEWAFPGARGNEALVEVGRDVRSDPGQLTLHSPGQVPTVSSRIGDGLVPFVQGLRQLERALGSETVQAVGMPL